MSRNLEHIFFCNERQKMKMSLEYVGNNTDKVEPKYRSTNIFNATFCTPHILDGILLNRTQVSDFRGRDKPPEPCNGSLREENGKIFLIYNPTPIYYHIYIANKNMWIEIPFSTSPPFTVANCSEQTLDILNPHDIIHAAGDKVPVSHRTFICDYRAIRKSHKSLDFGFGYRCRGENL